MRTLWQDIRFGARVLVRNPGFSLIVMLVLALGISGSTAVFSVVNGVLLRSLPYPDSDRIVTLWQVNPEVGHGRWPTSDLTFEEWRAQNACFETMAEYNTKMLSATKGSEAVRVRGAVVSGGFFAAMAMPPFLGRTFTDEEQREGGSPVVVVSYGFWQRHLGRDTALAAQQLRFDDRVFDVVGVMSPQFSFPESADLWIPRHLYPRQSYRTAHEWRVVGRLKAGVTMEKARAEMTAIAQRQKHMYGQDVEFTDVAVVPLREYLVGQVRSTLLVLLGAVGFLLATACANAVSLLLAHATTREKEMSLRAALGAARWRLAQQAVVESLLLAVPAGAAGMLLAAWTTKIMLSYEPGRLPLTERIGLDGTMLAFTLLASVLIAIILGLTRVVHLTGPRLHDRLKQDHRTQAGTTDSERTRGVLVTLQIAFTLVLLTGAGLLGRSFLRLIRRDMGFHTDGLLVMCLSHPDPKLEDHDAVARLARIHSQLLQRLRLIPGVTGVGGVDIIPLSDASCSGTFLIMQPNERIDSFDDFVRVLKNREQVGEAEFRVASDDYFRVMGIPLVSGRMFSEQDTIEAPHVALISASLAKQRWPNENPIGKSIQFGNMDGDLRPFTIIGIVQDVCERVNMPPEPIFYACSRQRPFRTSNFNVVIQAGAQPESLIASARRVLRDVDPTLAPRFRTMRQLLGDSLADRRFSLLLVATFGGIALFLALTGVYGVMSYSVRQRTREIGVRMAMGARPSDVLRLVIRRGLILIAAGIVLGLLITLVFVTFLRSMLIGIPSTDPFTLLVVMVLLSVAALLACCIPTLHAIRVDPVAALRCD
jgi:putative ABC transport system permease protein